MSQRTNVSKVDSKTFRNAMGHYPTGVAAVTGRDRDGELLALVVGTFSSVSLEPALVSFMPMKTSKTFNKMRNCTSLCINIFGGEQEQDMLQIARRWEKKFDGIEWYPSPSGDPVLTNSIAWIDTSIEDIVEAGDHWIVLCRVQDLEVTNPVSPLLFFQGGFGSFAGSTSGKLTHEILPAIHAAHSVSEQLEDLATIIGCEVSVFAAVSEDEFATVFHSLSDAATADHSFATRVPIVPPIGDTYQYDKPAAVQQRWMDKIKDSSEEIREIHTRRLDAVKEKGYLLAHLPLEGSSAYEQMIRATKEYRKASLTPDEQRAINELIGTTTVDYKHREIALEEIYNLASIVFPVRDPGGENTMTLRISQLPQNVTGETVAEWIRMCQSVSQLIEEQ